MITLQIKILEAPDGSVGASMIPDDATATPAEQVLASMLDFGLAAATEHFLTSARRGGVAVEGSEIKEYVAESMRKFEEAAMS